MSACCFGRNSFHQKYKFVPAHRPETNALTKKYARMETALLQTFVVHHITTTFPMDQLHGRARLAHKYIHVTITRFQTHFPDLSTHTIHSHAHISRMLRHNYTVVLIQIEHNYFLRDKGKQYKRNGKGGLFRMVTSIRNAHIRHCGYSIHALCGRQVCSSCPSLRLQSHISTELMMFCHRI